MPGGPCGSRIGRILRCSEGGDTRVGTHARVQPPPSLSARPEGARFTASAAERRAAFCCTFSGPPVRRPSVAPCPGNVLSTGLSYSGNERPIRRGSGDGARCPRQPVVLPCARSGSVGRRVTTILRSEAERRDIGVPIGSTAARRARAGPADRACPAAPARRVRPGPREIGLQPPEWVRRPISPG
jgi:hypothetical protein